MTFTLLWGGSDAGGGRGGQGRGRGGAGQGPGKAKDGRGFAMHRPSFHWFCPQPPSTLPIAAG